VAALLVVSTPGQARAQGIGDLAVAPTRIILEGRARTAQVSLLNKGSATAIYRISIINMQMTESGEYNRVEESGVDGGYADSLVRYAPRRVELTPGKSQTVRIILRKPSGLKEGEYRSHILFQAVPDPTVGQSVEMTTKDEELSIRLIVVPAITIPLIVRHGKLSASASLSDFRLDSDNSTPDGKPVLNFRISRSGSRSLFGDISVTYQPAGSTEKYVVGLINQLAVYTPNSHRNVALPLQVPEQIKLSAGRLLVEYRAQSAEEGDTLTRAEVELR
jgi:P pilus assembly chaperone PapD